MRSADEMADPALLHSHGRKAPSSFTCGAANLIPSTFSKGAGGRGDFFLSFFACGEP